jgi:3-deoxy-7-phosphoheptulonate synthase
MLQGLGIRVLRAGCYKPRTSPYTFRGMGEDGLKLLAEMRDKYGVLIATEMRDATHADKVIEYADIVQIGAKAMYDHGLLTAAGQCGKPVILKRGFSSTLQELVHAADFVMSCGNEQVILCERGIRSFETQTRFTLDLCGVAWLKEHCNLPVILDPSHAMGYAYGVADLARACTAMGVDGLLIETHPNPAQAKSDAAQQLSHEQFEKMYKSLKDVANAIGKRLV